jgi:hypothetical protein
MSPVSGPGGRPAVIGLAAGALVFLSACASGGPAPAAHGGNPASTALTPRQALRAAEADADNLTSVVDTFSLRARGALPQTTTGTTRYQLEPTLMASADIRMDVPGLNSRARSITTNDAIYINVGLTGGGFPSTSGRPGKPWIKINLTGVKVAAGVLAGLAQQTQAGLGATISVHLRISQLATNVHVAGTQTIGGVLTTEYAGSYRADKILKALTASDRTKVELDPLMKLTGAGPVYFREWIDGRHHLRKIVEFSTAHGTTTTSTDYFTAFNQPVHVTLPPASQVMAFGI